MTFAPNYGLMEAMRNYLMNISLGNGKNYSASICDEEWDAFVKAANGKPMNGFIVPSEVLEEIWNKDIPIPVSVTIVLA